MNLSKQVVVFSFLALFVAVPHTLHAASLSFSAPTPVSLGQEFVLTVYASSTETGFNAAEGIVSFPTHLFEVLSLDATANSTIFTFWLAKPTFSNEKGFIRFSGGTTNAVVGADVPIIAARVRAIGSGAGLITATDASINAADGSGTNILEDIDALRIAVSDATIFVPPSQALPTPAPIPAPIKTPTPQEPADAPLLSATTTQEPVTKTYPCTGIFADCDVHFPEIQSVDLARQEALGNRITVTGIAPDGVEVHLRLERGGTLYKEVIAVVQADRTWEAVLANVYAYGTYSIEAVAVTASGRKSDPVTWHDLRILPPYTLYLFGMPLRWYVLVASALSALTVVVSVFTIMLHTGLFGAPRWKLPALVLSVASAIALVSMFVVARTLWLEEYGPKRAFWKDTSLPCIPASTTLEAQYSTAYLTITVDGAVQEIPADTGISPACVAKIHTHDNLGHLHFEPAGREITLKDFFTVAGIAFERTGYSLSVTINGENRTANAGLHVLQDGDVVSVTYTSLK